MVIDITGAKKSMVAGAYLLAAYANLDVTYVDFAKYSPRDGRAFGYTCQIGTLENPYQIFRISEWQRARELYGQYAFRAALDTLEEIRAAAKSTDTEKQSLFDPEELKAIDRVCSMIEVYDLWENGNLYEAHALTVTITDQLKEAARSIDWDRIGRTTIRRVRRV